MTQYMRLQFISHKKFLLFFFSPPLTSFAVRESERVSSVGSSVPWCGIFFTQKFLKRVQKSKKESGDCTKLWQHNRGNYTNPTIYQKKKNKIPSGVLRLRTTFEYRPEFSHLMGLLGDCRHNKMNNLRGGGGGHAGCFVSRNRFILTAFLAHAPPHMPHPPFPPPSSLVRSV